VSRHCSRCAAWPGLGQRLNLILQSQDDATAAQKSVAGASLATSYFEKSSTRAVAGLEYPRPCEFTFANYRKYGAASRRSVCASQHSRESTHFVQFFGAVLCKSLRCRCGIVIYV